MEPLSSCKPLNSANHRPKEEEQQRREMSDQPAAYAATRGQQIQPLVILALFHAFSAAVTERMSGRVGNESVPIQLAQWAGIIKYYTESILSNSIRKLLWFDITKMLIAV